MDLFSRTLDLFIESLRLQTAVSGNTAVSYAVDLAQFMSFAEALENPKIEKFSDVSPKVIRMYMRAMSGWYAKSSIARKLSAMRAFFLFAVRSKAIESNPMKTIRGAAAPRPLPKAVSRETIDRMLDLARKTKHPVRDTLIFELLYGAGLRISELAALKWDDVDIESMFLVASGKGDKQRHVPFGRFAAQALADARRLDESGPKSAGGGYILPDKDGRSAINVRTVHRIVTGIAKAAGAFSVTPHSLRHSCATHMLEGGASLKFIQEFLGHENIATTQIYLTISASLMKERYAKAHPRAYFEEEDE